MNCYKFTEPVVLAAFEKRLADREAVRQAAHTFAAQFGPESGKPYFRRRDPYELVGVAFTPAKAGPLWTIPQSKDHYLQRPRASAPKLTPEQKVELKALNALWTATWPKQKMKDEPLFVAMGCDYDWLRGFHIFEHQGALFYRGSMKPSLGVEILGSEFEAALAAVKAGGA